MKKFTPLFLLGLPCLPGCVVIDQDEFASLRQGRWVEAKGQIVDGKPVVDEVDELQRSDSDKADKSEVTAPVKAASGSRLELLELRLDVDSETEFENADKQAIDPFVPDAGDWVRIKLRHKPEDDTLKLRTIRQSEARDQFKVEGEVLAYDQSAERLNVGGVQLRIKQDADIKMLGARDADDPLSLFQADDQKGVPFSVMIGDHLIFGGQAAFGFSMEDEYDLDETSQRDRSLGDLEAKVDALWLIGDTGSYVLAEVNAARSDRMRRDSPDTHDERVELARAFGSISISDGFQVLVGRQDFDEGREWVYDEVLDGVRAILRVEDMKFELFGAVGRDIGVNPNEFDQSDFFGVSSRYNIDEDWMLGAYVVKRTDDSDTDHEPLQFGLRSIDEPRYGLGHWAELGFARGHTRSTADGTLNNILAQAEDIRGWAFDIGGIYTFEAPLRPAIALGYAFGSGARDSADHQGFRQTGFQDNNGKLGGVTSVRYYGELLRPELANLAVLTVGAAIRPIEGGSVSLLFHHYVQDYAAEYGPFTDLRQRNGNRPNGRSPGLGYEVDLVFGYRLARRLTFELVGSRFEPGAAFDNTDAANKLDLTMRLSF